MTDLQGYLTILAGFLISFTLVLSGKQVFQKALVKIFICELLFKASYYTLKIVLTPIDKGPLLKAILSYKYFPDVAFMGLFLGCFTAAFLNRERFSRFYGQVIIKSAVIYNLLIAAIGTTYLLSALSAIINFKGWLIFFDSCGYSKDFLIFIILLETVGGVGILFTNTRTAALLLLSADMAGAAFTHFNNYFSRKIPDPLGNSLPSLAMLTILSSLIILSLSAEKIKKQKGNFNKR